MNRKQADLNEANIRLKRWLRAVEKVRRLDGRALVTNPGKPEVRTSAAWPFPTRWRVFERLKWTLDGTANGEIVETECCVASASTAPDVVLKYTLWVQDPARAGFFRDRDYRGEDQRTPPADPPEFAAEKEKQAAAMARGAEIRAENIKRSARAQMAWIGMDDPVKFELAWDKAVAMGMVRKL